ncbi:hypothetical protein EDD29_4174 [Actinocorallia herbida]|uniref:Uncharacterized protein n=1 Tax=Actinocorallia herbida TaxID=58109 RepID=A0A3N1CZ80_9ACTN|nr:hypothetical protein [Actinocorallia herbida]ROO86601.1 hypothetical protein EDD29_4174 [Actinocorallia herbida]
MKRTLCLLLPAVLTAPFAATPAVAAPEFWKTHLESPDYDLDRVESFGKADTWFYGEAVVVGEQAPVWHWNGKRLVKTKLPAAFEGSLADVDFAARTNGWAVGFDREPSGRAKVVVLRWNGKKWRIVRKGNTGTRSSGGPAIKVLGGGAVVVTGLSRGKTLLQWRFNGKTWKEVETKADLTAFSGRYAVGVFGNGPGLARWTGKSWKRVKVGALPAVGAKDFLEMEHVEAASAKDVWVTADVYKADETGGTYVVHWNGERWKRIRVPIPVTGVVHDIASDGRGGLWVAAEPANRDIDTVGTTTRLLHRLPSGKWKQMPTDVLAFGLARVPGSTALWAVGERLPSGPLNVHGIFTRGGAE